jgi:arylamine N-acetyltransferase
MNGKVRTQDAAETSVPALVRPAAELDADPGLLDPFLHTDAVTVFYRHFSVSAGPPGLEGLEEILSHFSKFPYENLSKIIRHHEAAGTAQKLRFPIEVMDGYIRHRFGGTCFSLTFFLQTLLVHAGYRCYPVMADMKWAPNSHCAMIVLLEGRQYLVDPGYLLNRPMEMTLDKPRVFDSEFTGVEMVRHGFGDSGVCEVRTFNRTETKSRYRFRDVPCPAGEFLRHWTDSFGWNSMHGLCLTRAEKGRMVYIHKYFMRESTFEGKRNFNIRQDYHARIRQAFGIEEEITERALAALDANMARERALGLWKPKEKRSNI